MYSKIGVRFILCVFLGQIVHAPQPLYADEQNIINSTLVIGRISAKPSSKLLQLEKMSEYLSEILPGAENIEFGEIITPSVHSMAELLISGKVDLISETPLAAMELVNNAGAEIILGEWKKGVSEYSSILFTKETSSINALDDLKGRVIAFEDAGSTSGFLLPLALLRLSGLTCVELKNVNEKPAADQVGYIFAGHEINVSTLVARGVVDAGALSNLDWDDNNEVPYVFRQTLRVFFESKPIMRSVVLVRGDMDEGLKENIMHHFEQMHKTPKGRKAMKKYNKVLKYDRVNTEIREQLNHVREVYHLVRDKFN